MSFNTYQNYREYENYEYTELFPNGRTEERVNELIDISNELEKNYLDRFIGKNVDVLIETVKDGKSIGHTGNYLKVEINEELKRNTIVNVIIKKRIENYLEGEKK